MHVMNIKMFSKTAMIYFMSERTAKVIEVPFQKYDCFAPRLPADASEKGYRPLDLKAFVATKVSKKIIEVRK